MEHNEHHTLKEKILSTINAKGLSMHPKYYFWLRVAAITVVSVAALLISVFIFNFILFSIRLNSHDAFLSFGPRGWGAFLYFFPWELLTLEVVLVGLLLWLLRQFRFGYQSPLLYMLLGLFIITFAAGLMLDRTTGINERFLRDADNRRLPPPFNEFYGHARRVPPPGSGVCTCTIVSINGSTLIVSNPRASSTQLTAILPPNDARATSSNLKVGDTVFIAGERHDETINVFGLRKLFIDDRMK